MEHSTIVVQPEDIPVRVNDVAVEGLSHSSPTLVRSYFKNVVNAKNSAELLEALSVGSQRLSNTDLYKSIDLDVIPSTHPEASYHDVDLLVRLKEKSRFGAVFGVGQGTPGGSTLAESTSFFIRNPIFGLGERLDVNMNTSQDMTGTSLNHVQVKLGNMKICPFQTGSYNLNISQDFLDRKYLANYDATVQTIGVGYTHGGHVVEYNAGFRHITPAVGATAVIADALVPTTKSSVKYEYTRSSCYPNEKTPQEGSFTTFRTEIAGLGGDVQGLKLEVAHQQHITLVPNAVLSLTGRAGVMQTLTNIKKITTAKMHKQTITGLDNINIVDKFFLNTLHVRGAEVNKLGPVANEAALGGDAYTAFTATITGKLPKFENGPFFPHAFYNAATLVSLVDHANSGKEGCAFKDVHQSIGAGFVLPTNVGRIEINAVAPISKDGLGKFGVKLAAGLEW